MNNNSQIIFTVGNVQTVIFATVPVSNIPVKISLPLRQAQIQVDGGICA